MIDESIKEDMPFIGNVSMFRAQLHLKPNPRSRPGLWIR